MKKLVAAVLALVMCFTVVSCFAEANTELRIDVALGYSEPHSMDPTMCTGNDQSEILVHMYEGLFKYEAIDTASGNNPDMMGAKLVNGQITGYEFDEATLTYTFHLRDDIYWSDGQPVTAQDFVYSWQRLVNPQTAASNGKTLNDIVLNASAIQAGEKDVSELGITALDDKTLQVVLENNCAYFLTLTTSYYLYPLRQDIIEQYGDTWNEPETIVSNGAYKLTAWVHDSYMQLEQNDKYYDHENVGPDKIVFHLTDSQTSNMAAYKSGDYDFISSVAADQIESLTASGDLFTNPRISVTYLYMSTVNIPDWRVRAAILLAIDRDNIVTNVTQDGSTEAVTLVPAGITTSTGESWASANAYSIYAWLQEQYPDYDLTVYADRCDLATELYAAAVADGWDTSKTLDYQYNTSDTNKAVAEAVQSDLDTVLGINVILNNIDSAGYTQTISQGNYSLARLGYGVSYNDAIGYFNLFGTDGSFEYASYSNADYDAQKAALVSIPAGEERDTALANLELTMYNDTGFSICQLYDSSYVYCMKNNVKNVYYVTTGCLTIFTYATK